jgi:hypothetical protein
MDASRAAPKWLYKQPDLMRVPEDPDSIKLIPAGEMRQLLAWILELLFGGDIKIPSC